MENSGSDITERVKTVRIDRCGQRGRAKFARELGISPSTYHFYESSRVPPVETLVRIAEVTGARLEWLLTGQGPPYGRVDVPGGASPAAVRVQHRVAELLARAPRFASTVEAFLDTLREVADLGPPAARAAESQERTSLRAGELVPVVGYTAATPAHFWQELGQDRPPAGELDRKIEEILFGRETARQPARVEGSADAAIPGGTVALVQVAAPDERGLVEFLDAPQFRARFPDAVAWRIDGDSMSPRYRHGDLVIGSSRVPARPGHPCIARLRGQIGVVCKIYEPEGSLLRLVPLNEAFPTQEFPLDDLEWAIAVLSCVRLQGARAPASGD